MKTNFLPRSKRSRNKRKELMLVCAVFIVAVLFLSMFGNVLSSVLAPLWSSHIYTRIGLSNLVGSLRSKDALIAENIDLKQKLALDEELIISLRAISSSRDELLATFGRAPTGATPAMVLVHPPETPYDILVVDAGENLSVRAGSTVLTPQGSVLGLVGDVLSRTSRVKLFSTAGERTDAVLERGNVAVTLVGRGGGDMSFTLPRDMAVSAGDRIVSARIDASLMGVVMDIEVSPTDSQKTVLVRSPINPESVRSVLIER